MDKKTREIMHSSNSTDWRTPSDLFEALNKEFSFVLDAAADEENHLCKNYFTENGHYDGSLLLDDTNGLTGR